MNKYDDIAKYIVILSILCKKTLNVFYYTSCLSIAFCTVKTFMCMIESSFLCARQLQYNRSSAVIVRF